jgi:serine/threonine-protein phosphatase 5
MEELLPYLKDQKKLHKRYAYQILVSCKNEFAILPSLVEIEIPECAKITVCGDIQ